MQILKADNSEGFWMMAAIDSPKVQEIKQDDTVGLFLQASDKWVCCTGKANIVQDKSKIAELWKEGLRPYFPKGKEQPEASLIQVIPTVGEFWDNSGVLNKLKFAAEITKSYVTNTKVDATQLGETKKLDMETGTELSQPGIEGGAGLRK